MSTQPAHDLGASSNDSTIPITDSQILPLRSVQPTSGVDAWRRRLAPARRLVFAGAIVFGALVGATLFFVTHPANATLERATGAVSTPAAPAPSITAPTAQAAPASPAANGEAPAAVAPRPVKRSAKATPNERSNSNTATAPQARRK